MSPTVRLTAPTPRDPLPRLRSALSAAVRQEAETVLSSAVALVPVASGRLRDSGHVEVDGMAASVVFGGPAAPYAVVVHEALEARHASGQAKFLEAPARTAAPGMAARLARRIAGELRRGGA